MKQETTQQPQINYDDVTADEGDALNTDVKINPEFYIHMAILRSQKALLSPNLNEGLIQYRLLIEQIEVICKSAGLVSIDDYSQKIKEFIEKDEYKIESNQLVKSAKIASEKLRLLLEEVFSNKISTAPLKV